MVESTASSDASSEDDPCEKPDSERKIAEQSTKIAELEEKFGQVENEVNNFRHKNIDLKEKLAECKCQQKIMSSPLFCVDRFTSDGYISCYTSLSSRDVYGFKSWRQL